MKRIIASLLMVVSLTATAHGPRYNYGHHPSHGWGWVAPALIGGAIVYGMTRPTPPQPAPAVIVVPPNYPPPPQGYHYEQLLDANCNCYRWVLVQGY